MPRIRVLVVDDAVVVRRLVTDALSADDTVEVVGTAPNGRVALSKITQVNPDVVTLDVEMPEMDGIETLAAIRERHPRLPVIMFSTRTERGAAITMEALLGGANDYVTKPANVGSVAEAIQAVRDQLLPTIHGLCGRGSAAPSPVRRRVLHDASRTLRAVHRPARSVEVVVIGVSTGGPNALATLVPALPANLPVPVLIVQHMPAMFTRLLAERLDAQSPLLVTEAAGGDEVVAGRVLLAPGDHHLEVERHGAHVRASIGRGVPENSCRPSVDVLLRSAVGAYGANTLAIVLTGMGADGRRGAEHVHEAGGAVLVQDEASSVVWGMPGAVVAAGVADEIVPLDDMARAIGRRVAAGSSRALEAHR